MLKLLSLALGRPASRFEGVIAPCLEGLYKQAYHYTGTANDAEDLLQDLLLDVFQKRELLLTVEHPKAWLQRCLYRRFIDRYRKLQRQPVYLVVPEPAGDADQSVDALDLAVADVRQDFSEPERALMQGQIQQHLMSLSPAQRAVIVLHDIEGHKLIELENILDMPVGTLKSHLHRGRKTLKTLLMTEG